MITESDFDMLAMVITYVIDLVKEIWKGRKENKELTKCALDNECCLHKEKRDKERQLLEEKTINKKNMSENESDLDQKVE